MLRKNFPGRKMLRRTSALFRLTIGLGGPEKVQSLLKSSSRKMAKGTVRRLTELKTLQERLS